MNKKGIICDSFIFLGIIIGSFLVVALFNITSTDTIKEGSTYTVLDKTIVPESTDTEVTLIPSGKGAFIPMTSPRTTPEKFMITVREEKTNSKVVTKTVQVTPEFYRDTEVGHTGVWGKADN